VHVVKTDPLYRLTILSKIGGRHVSAQHGPIERRPIVTIRFTEGRKINLNKRKQRKFEQKLTKLAKVRHLPSGKLFFRIRSLPSLTHRDFKTPISNKRPQYRERYGSVGILPAHARRVDAPRWMQLPKCALASHLRSEPEEVNVASGVVAMVPVGCGGAASAAAEGRMPTLRCAQIM